jgi:hypothetical protein
VKRADDRLLLMRKKKKAPKKKAARRSKPARARKVARTGPSAVAAEKGLGLVSAGQSGDIQGLSRNPDADSESVEELAEEGQAFEAEAISGVESAPRPDEKEVTTREAPEDDVPPEYQGQD